MYAEVKSTSGTTMWIQIMDDSFLRPSAEETGRVAPVKKQKVYVCRPENLYIRGEARESLALARALPALPSRRMQFFAMLRGGWRARSRLKGRGLPVSVGECAAAQRAGKGVRALPFRFSCLRQVSPTRLDLGAIPWARENQRSRVAFRAEVSDGHVCKIGRGVPCGKRFWGRCLHLRFLALVEFLGSLLESSGI